MDIQENGLSARDVAEHYPGMFIKYSRGIERLSFHTRETLVFQNPREAVDVVLLYGPTGCGKTLTAFSAGTAFSTWAVPLSGSEWFDGYIGQNVAILDDFAGRASKFELSKLLRLLDRYILQVPVKGGFTYFDPAVVYVTTNIHPCEWYDYSSRGEQFRALARRFSRVVCFDRIADESIVGLGRGIPAAIEGFRRLNILRDSRHWSQFWAGPPAAPLPVLGPMDLWAVRSATPQYSFIF